jgi:hypothetical protein
MAKFGHRYSVYVDDNFHYQDEADRYKLGDFPTYNEAVTACKNMVDQFLKENSSAEKSAKERYEHYTSFGPDPHVMTDDPVVGRPAFSAWDYARERCEGWGRD